MISVEKAIQFVLSQRPVLKKSIVKIQDSLGLILAKDIYTSISLPSFRQSAMDGYAICGIHNTYTLTTEIQAGKSSDIKMKDGEAIRIFTGAAVPTTATAVIMQEKVIADNKSITISDDVIEGKNIRPIGEQIQEGQLIFKKGEMITPGSIGLLASMGISEIEVYTKPSISLSSTGNELKPLNEKLEYGEIYESNSYTLIAAAKEKGFDINSKSVLKDTYEETKSGIEKLLIANDVILISGGISVGDYDFVGKALIDLGVEEIFYKVKQKPGKPLFFGKKGDKFVFALPGNPAAALTCFYVYVLPLLRKIKGEENGMLESFSIPISHDFIKKGNRATFLKSKIENGQVTLLDGQASSMIYSYSQSNALVFLPEEIIELKKGDSVLAYKL